MPRITPETLAGLERYRQRRRQEQKELAQLAREINGDIEVPKSITRPAGRGPNNGCEMSYIEIAHVLYDEGLTDYLWTVQQVSYHMCKGIKKLREMID